MEKRIYKSEEELKKQVLEASSDLGVDISPPYSDNYSYKNIERNHSVRYSAYLQLLRNRKNGSEINSEDKQELQSYIHALNNLDQYIANHEQNPEDRVLRERQFTVFEDVRNFLEEGNNEGYIKLPTGVGKTVLFSQIIEALDLKSLVIVPSKILVNQTSQSLDKFTDVEHGKYYQDEKEVDSKVTVITYQSLINSVSNKVIDPAEYQLLILDEVHKALGEKTIETINSFKGIKIGLTATPEYSSNKHVSGLLEKEIHTMTIIEGVQEGLINRFKSILAYTTTDLSNVSLNYNQEYDAAELEKAVNNEARNLSAVELYKNVFNGERAVAYCSGVKHAKAMAKLFQENGVEAAVIDGSTKPDERDALLEQFHSGEIKILCNARVLIEGFDEPRAVVAFNLHPTLSYVDAEQRGGRVLRLDDENPEKWAYIVDFIDRTPQRPMLLFSEVANTAEMEKMSSNSDSSAKKKSAESIGENTAENRLSEINVNGLNVIVDTEEIMSISKDFSEQREEVEIAPAGWLNSNQISKKYNVPYMAIKELAREISQDRPDWINQFKSEQGVVYDYYHPDFILKIIEKLKIKSEVELAPNGWITHKGSQSILGASQKSVLLKAEQFRESNPEWFKKLRTTQGRILEHYSPELIEKLKNIFEKLKPPKGWKTASKLRKELKSSDVTIRKFAEQFRESNPEWLKKYPVRIGTTDFYSPELVKKIESEFSTIEYSKPPKGWMTVSKLSSKNKMDYGTVSKFANNFRESNPEWFKKYKTKTKVAEHFHPDLVKEILTWDAEKKSITAPPEGWMTAYSLALTHGHARETIVRDVEKFRKKHPEWFENYKAGNMITEHFHPYLVKEILALYNN